MDITKKTSCPSCGLTIPNDALFCPQCGAQLKESSTSTSIGRQILIYFISLFLAPFGLIYVFKYLKQSDPMAKKIGLVALILTIIAIALMIWITRAYVTSLSDSLSALNAVK